MAGGDVIVIGAGVIGSAVAHALARRGASVLVLERDRPAAHASGAAAGMLAPFTESHAEGPLLEIGARALERLRTVVEEVRDVSGIDPAFVERGILRVAGEEEAALLRERAAKLEPHGLRWMDRQELHSLEPGVTAEAAGAIWSPNEGHLDPGLFTRSLVGAALARGARLEVGLPVHSLWIERGRARGVRTADGLRDGSNVVICAGAWSRIFEGELALEIPVDPVRGQMIELEAPGRASRPILWGSAAYLVPRRDGTLLVGATVERVGFDATVTAGGIESLLSGARAILPEAEGWRFRGARAGLRPATPDGLPLVGPIPGIHGVWLATGHHRNGILLAAATGEMIAEGIATGVACRETSFLSPARFAR
jgi:glycine oxidase